MFLCEKCHKESKCDWLHLYKSLGPCEACGETHICYNCQSPNPVRMKAKTRRRRRKVHIPVILECKPILESSKEELIREFLRVGCSFHSPRHDTLGYIIEYCEEHKIPYRLTAVPTKGYMISKHPFND